MLVVHELRAGAVYIYLGSPGLLYLALCLCQGAPPRVGWGGGGSRRQQAAERGGWLGCNAVLEGLETRKAGKLHHIGENEQNGAMWQMHRLRVCNAVKEESQ